MDSRMKVEQILPAGQSQVPAFLLKLRNLLDDRDNDNLIAWDAAGESFHLYDQVKFARDVLPKYFKHNNLASFVRQLNMYGFKKVSSIEHGGLQPKADMEFQNIYFVRDQPELMARIKRKNPKVERQISTSLREKLGELGTLNPTQASDVLVDIKELKHSQDSVNEQLSLIKRENGALWREVASLRQKHVQQQHIINKLIHFLMSMASKRRSLKRSLPMIELEPTKKHAAERYVTPIATENSQFLPGSIVQLDDDLEPPSSAIAIRDITEIPDDVIPSFTVDSGGEDQISPLSSVPVTVTSEAPDMLGDAAGSQSVAMVPRSLSPNPDVLDFKTNLSDNIESVQTDIDWLKDLFNNDSLGLPSNTVDDLFDGSHAMPPQLPRRYLADSAMSDDLDDLLENANSGRKEDFLHNVSSQLPNELDSLIGGVGDQGDISTSTASLQDLLDESRVSTGQQPIISSNDLD